MRTTIVLDDEQIRQAQQYTGIVEKSALVRKALQTLIELEASRRLALLGGTMPGLQKIPRRKSTRDSRRYQRVDRPLSFL